MGLYDKYQLANSTAIPVYQGSALPEFARSIEMAQERYDTASQGALTINDTVTNTPFLPQDSPTWNRIKQNTDQDLDQWSSRGDYENLLPDVQRKARITANRLKPLVESVQKRTEYAKALEDKDLGLTALDKKTLLEMSDRAYKGVQYDENGRGFGQYSGRPAEKNVDVNDTIRKALSIMNPSGGIVERGSEDGMWRRMTKRGWEAITTDEIDKALKYAYANDNEWKAHINQQVDLETFRQTKNFLDYTPDIALKSLNRLPDGTLKEQAMSAIARGVNPKDVLYDIVAQDTRRFTEAKMMNNIRGYGHSKAYEKTTSTDDKQYSSIYEMDYRHNLDKQMEDYKQQWDERKNFNPFMVKGPQTKLSDDEQDPDKVVQNNTNLRGSITKANEEIKTYKGQLENTSLTPEQRVQIQSNLNNATSRLATMQEELQRNESLIDHVKDRTAQNMGYAGGYQEMLKGDISKTLPKVEKLLPGGVKTADGKTISTKEIAQSILEGGVKPETAGGRLSYVTITTKDGKVARISSDGIKALSGNDIADNLNALSGKISRDQDLKVNTLNTKFKADYKNNIKDFSIGSDAVGFKDQKTRDELTTVLKGAIGGLEFSEPGQFQNLSEDERPIGFQVLTIRPQGVGNKLIFQVEGKDEDGKLTGKYYDVKVDDVNIARSISQGMYNNGSKEGANVARMLQPNSGARLLNSKSVGEKIVAGKLEMDDGRISDITVQSNRNRDNSITYNAYDDKGTIIFTTDIPSTMGEYIDHIKGNNNTDADYQYIKPRKKLKSTTTTSKTVKRTTTNAED